MDIAQDVYCSLPFVQCEGVPAGRTCLELWMESTLESILFAKEFVTFSVFFTVGLMADLFTSVYCWLPGVVCSKAPEPVTEDPSNLLQEYLKSLLWTPFGIFVKSTIAFLSSGFISTLVMSFFLSLLVVKVTKVVIRILKPELLENPPDVYAASGLNEGSPQANEIPEGVSDHIEN